MNTRRQTGHDGVTRRRKYKRSHSIVRGVATELHQHLGPRSLQLHLDNNIANHEVRPVLCRKGMLAYECQTGVGQHALYRILNVLLVNTAMSMRTQCGNHFCNQLVCD